MSINLHAVQLNEAIPPLPRDAALPHGPGLIFATASHPLSEVISTWQRMIEGQQLIDLSVKYPELDVRQLDGGLIRRNGRGVLAYTPHGWGMLVNLLTHGLTRPNNLANVTRWLNPLARSYAFMDMQNRAKRPGDEPFIFRTAYSVQYQLRYLRACVSVRHSGTHLDDLALSKVLAAKLRPDLPSYVQRTDDFTHGYVVVGQTGALRASLHFTNSETCCGSLTFTGGAVIRFVDAPVRFGAYGESVVVDLGDENEVRRMRHTSPNKGGPEMKAQIAANRMAHGIDGALSGAQRLPAMWERACNDIPMLVQMHPHGWEVLGDALQEMPSKRAPNTEDVTALMQVLKDDERLLQCPRGSAAQVAAAFAVLAVKSGSYTEATRLQEVAGQWLRLGWTGKE
jgi:hypothetical protein